MRDFRPDLMARAAVTRIANHDPRTVEEIPVAMGEYGKGMTKAELVVVVGYLAKWVLKSDGGAA